MPCLEAGTSLLQCLPLTQDRMLLLDKLGTIKGSSGPKAEETPAPAWAASLVPPGGLGGCRRPSSFSPWDQAVKMAEVLPGRLSHLLQIAPLWENQ